MFKITNGNAFTFSAAFNGETYTFPSGRTVACEDEAVAHIFGLDQTDKTGILSRHGWITVTGPKADGLAILANFMFEVVKPAMEIESARVAHGPAPMPRVADDEGGITDGVPPKSSVSRGVAVGRQSPSEAPGTI